ncbi:MAG: preprotein translocase subunit SecE [Holosporales bacterium]|nr:preprotein translocase subunit SecE [Holosporales bacterium]
MSVEKKTLLQRGLLFLSEVKSEIKQVFWPTKKEAGVTTVVVCIFAFVMAAYLFIIDRSLLSLIQWIIN